MPPPAFWRFTWHLPHVTGALPAVALVLNPRRGRFAHVLSSCGPFEWILLQIWQFCLLPHWFLQPEVMGIYLPGAGTLGSVIWPEAGIPHSQGILSIFIHRA